MEITDLASDGQRLYWTTCTMGATWANAGSVMTAPATGGAADVFAPAGNCPRNLSIDDTAVYWTDGGLWMHPTTGGTTQLVLANARLQDPALLANLGISLRDETSSVTVDRLLYADADNLYLTIFVDNGAGLISCTDQYDVLVRMSRTSGTLTRLRTVMGSISTAVVHGSTMYMASACSRGVIAANLTSNNTNIFFAQDNVINALAIGTTRIYLGRDDGEILVLTPKESQNTVLYMPLIRVGTVEATRLEVQQPPCAG
ncbi:MAG: hypothetical protein HGA19_00390 [Oscillochloris sp.]|nr:hypothetical protein [Oscillochloris sp.]